MVSSHIRHFGTISSAGVGVGGGGGLKKWKYQLLWKISIYPLTFFQFVWEQECETETYSISLKASVVLFASIFQINFILVCYLALIFALVFFCCIFALNVLPLPFFCPQVLPLPSKCQQKRGQGKGKISFLPSYSFPHVFCPQILPLPLPSFFALVFRAKKEGKGKGKIWGQNTWGNEEEGKKEGKTRNY